MTTRWEEYGVCVDCAAYAGEACVFGAPISRDGAKPRLPMSTPHYSRPRVRPARPPGDGDQR